MEEVKPGSKADAHKKSSKLWQRCRVWLALAFFVLGAFAMVGIRFATIKDDHVHYHANFALYINGQQDMFKNFTFYEEIAACTANSPDDVKERAHMHDNNPSLIHVHAHAVTWSQFFDNLGYSLGNKDIATDNGVFADGQDGNKLSFILNGKPVVSIANSVIKFEDVLLINYGKDGDATLQSRYNAIPRTAHQANVEQDPSTCSGSHKLTFTDRLKQAVGFAPAAQ